ncbi:hypothetical protein [Segniliparus rugosus]|uniref:FtsK domain-containing protein n=1 Tax=Segniliparus rugosus (strain ATCC BAA-974 / DSM 45345 / CCUG 50838 / CIP 108380 / JCM 13579 / CDC 945) TaxID=679197 RepID=E5XMT7_SEGRC|nr:hypothetical protein [Segniliparus rugosus]EFV14357.1 hypothetical protein HMPREF9336_00807 [Segniliparus rugosus ATCC BAA-974]
MTDTATTPSREAVVRVLRQRTEEAYSHQLGLLGRDDEWFALLKKAGLLHVRSETERNPDGSATTHIYETAPRLAKIAVTRLGLELWFRPLTGQSLETWKAASGALRTAMRAPRLAVAERHDPEALFGLQLRDKDPFEAATADMGDTPASAKDGARSVLGVDEDGEPAEIVWRGSSGMVVGGVPGSGKTASLLPVFAGLAGQAELHVFDGKAGYDLHALRHIARTYDRTGDVDAPLAALERLEVLRQVRSEALYPATGEPNFWNLAADHPLRLSNVPVFAILDEVQTWLDTSGMDAEEKKASARITRLVRTLIQKGRSAGVVTVLTTQKPDATSIPTVIRDNAALKLCFKVSTQEQAKTVLGELPEGVAPTAIPLKAKGRYVLDVEGQGHKTVQSHYVPPQKLDAHLAQSQPVPDQLEAALDLLDPERRGHYRATLTRIEKTSR